MSIKTFSRENNSTITNAMTISRSVCLYGKSASFFMSLKSFLGNSKTFIFSPL